jgi:hypothetical protein
MRREHRRAEHHAGGKKLVDKTVFRPANRLRVELRLLEKCGRIKKRLVNLLAEDDDDMRRFLVKALEKRGLPRQPFDNGASAYDGCARSRSSCC